MGCGASARKKSAPPGAEGLRELLKGLGVREVAKAEAALSKRGVSSRHKLTRLDDAAWREADMALQKAGLAAGDRERIDMARRLEMEVPMGNCRVPVVVLSAGQALQLPSDMQRVFLAVGRRAGPGPGLGVSCAAFAGGADAGSVPSEQAENHNWNSSILHTGAQLHGDASGAAAGLHDLERVYVWLSRVLPTEQTDCLVFIARIDASNDSNASMDGAYARLVNADTNQELCRLSLPGLGPQAAAVVGKLYRRHTTPSRASGPWQFLALAMPLPDGVELGRELRRTACCFPPRARGQEAGEQQRRRRAEDYPSGVLIDDQLPLAVILYSDLAGATQDGVSAATRLFTAGSDVTRDMLMSTSFEKGVDFSALKPAAEPVIGHADLLPQDAVSTVYAWAGDALDAGGGAAMALGEAVGYAGGAAVEGLGAACEAVGSGAAEGAVRAAAVVGEAAGTAGGGVAEGAAKAAAVVGEAAGTAGGGVAEVAVKAAGAVGEAAGAAGGGVAEGLGAVAGAVGEAGGGLGEAAGAAVSGVAQVAEVGGGAVGAAAEAAGGLGNVVATVASAAGGLAGGALEVAGGALEVAGGVLEAAGPALEVVGAVAGGALEVVGGVAGALG